MIVKLTETDSTNNYAKIHAAELDHGDAVSARWQSAGRGQRGNSWESERDANVMMTVVLEPAMPVDHAFGISEAVALAVATTVAELLPMAISEEVKVKWPNDIYVGDRKIAGILIENALSATTVARSIAGIGLNVNQSRFLSDAPNPVSIKQLTGADNDVDRLTELIARRIVEQLDRDYNLRHADYMALLWRRNGMHQFVDTATDQRFEAEVVAVAPSGHITLSTSDGHLRHYAFKQIEWL
ncbi:MAG: biotin--[acetyl-CoA-carboxylase] ligase [Bacteroides sp.]|nr:biotin--[acetyl-CoA-carboxylase] ligase [Bacteroides sp.]MCM1413545.1 biotin--[acetyl-CoA-carboxylase] ligase [Bacteroides sp.]MCM1471099.1 biotin--[acetyl-CoA-carboxylase] ligase [Bacteroides sp.]